MFRIRVSHPLALALITLGPVAQGVNHGHLAPCAEAVISADKLKGILVDQIGVETHDFPASTILHHLNIPPEMIPTHVSKKILLVGEGYSNLLPYLIAQGARHVLAVDPWYHRFDIPQTTDGRRMQEYILRYDDFLVQASAVDLPFEDEAIDEIWSHLFLNNVGDVEVQYAIVREGLRVLKKGGQACWFGFIPSLGVDGIASRLRAAGHPTTTYSRSWKVRFTGEEKTREINFLGLKLEK